MTARFPEPDHRSKADQIADRRRRDKATLPIRFICIVLGVVGVSLFAIEGVFSWVLGQFTGH